MVNRVTLVVLVALAAVALAERGPAKIAPIVQRMLDSYSAPKIPKGYVSRGANTTVHRFRTRIDHFNPQNRATFEFDYYSNDQYYKPGGPIFIFLGGPWPAITYYIEHGHFHDLAFYENAWLFTNEHRYYGNSVPTEDLSTENLRWLTTDQVLVDLAEWIFHLRHNVVRDADARVILLGLGNAGNLAAWMRQRYPHLVEGAWVSSGRIEARLNFKEYAMEVGELIRNHGSNECYSQIWRGFRTAQILMDAGLASTVTDLFNTCKPIDMETLVDVAMFFFNIKESLQLAMLLEADVEVINRVCGQFNNSTETTDLQTLANFIKEYYGFMECLPFDFATYIETHKHIEKHFPENLYLGVRQRMYQVCTEFGWFLTTDSPDQPFGYRVTMYLFFSFCQRVYGNWLDVIAVGDGVYRTNMHFGGKNPRISNVLFTNGGLDPMRDVSITEYYQAGSTAIVIPDYFGGADLTSISGYDSAELLEAKHTIHKFVESWLWEPIVPV